jgi:hypothetical protein
MLIQMKTKLKNRMAVSLQKILECIDSFQWGIRLLFSMLQKVQQSEAIVNADRRVQNI